MSEDILKQVNKKLRTKLGIDQKVSHLALPRIIKVVINVGVGKVKDNPAIVEKIEKSLVSITGQKPSPRLARKAISGFKIRQGEKIGLQVTLRGNRMKDFVVKLANIVLPRMRDFRGLKMKGFDQKGNYNLGIAEQLVFPEISHEKTEELFGLSATLVTSAENPQEGRALLKAWGLPFVKES